MGVKIIIFLIYANILLLTKYQWIDLDPCIPVYMMNCTGSFLQYEDNLHH